MVPAATKIALSILNKNGDDINDLFDGTYTSDFKVMEQVIQLAKKGEGPPKPSLTKKEINQNGKEKS